MRVVVDTNVVVSHYITPAARAAQVLHAWEAYRFDLVTSEAILTETRHVLGYSHLRACHQMDEAEIAQVIEDFRELAILVEPAGVHGVVKGDADDDKFLVCAIGGNVDLIVSGDRHLLALGAYAGIPIITPSPSCCARSRKARATAGRSLTDNGHGPPIAATKHRCHWQA
ncbi:MAG: putative toxin-antitoxin system toxin component, PIN family [Chloroflexi bacterium]|nr:putative toxin-antitoxin system toxin component, PIN family [Chloroflexota bacterium]